MIHMLQHILAKSQKCRMKALFLPKITQKFNAILFCFQALQHLLEDLCIIIIDFHLVCQRETDVQVQLLGGVLTIRVCADGSVLMTGPAKTVYEGKAILPE